MTTNVYDINIQAPPDAVWQALTDKEPEKSWMGGVKVVSDWQQGDDITYTCYEKDGSIMRWNDKDMVWSGKTSVLNEPREFTCDYSAGDTGLLSESYTLTPTGNAQTDVHFVQECTSEEAAAGYKEGMDEMLKMLKDYLEGTEA